jgi:hypothetical protein
MLRILGAYGINSGVAAGMALAQGSPGLSDEQDDHYDDQNQAQTAGWIISPAGAVRPKRERAHQQQNQQNNEDQAHEASPFDLKTLSVSNR